MKDNIENAIHAAAKQQILRMIDQRDELKEELNRLNQQITGVRLILGEDTFQEILRKNNHIKDQDSKRSPKGSKKYLLLKLLRETYPHSLTLDEIIEKGRANGVRFLRTSLRSQLSKLNAEDQIEVQGGYYKLNPGALEE